MRANQFVRTRDGLSVDSATRRQQIPGAHVLSLTSHLPAAVAYVEVKGPPVVRHLRRAVLPPRNAQQGIVDARTCHGMTDTMR